MLNQYCISVIVPFFNAKLHIEKCIKSLKNQDFNKSFEIIMVDDASYDTGKEKVKNLMDNNIRLFSLKNNSGPGAARALGLKKAKGEYIFFLDVDDTIEKSALSTLYKIAKKNNFDLVFCDRKWVENFKNIRKEKYAYSKNKFFNKIELKKSMNKRFYDPLYAVGLFQLTGRLIKRSIIVKNKITFEKKLRYLEDESFEWDILGYIRNAIYIRKQLYSYYLHNNISTGLSEGISKNFPISNFKLVKKHIEKSLKNKKFTRKNIKKIGNQGFIFLIVSSLISLSRSILLGKISLRSGNKAKTKLISNILSNSDVKAAINDYTISNKESSGIIKAIKFKLPNLLNSASTIRAKEIINLRREKK